MKNTLKAIILTATLVGSIISFTGCGVQEVDPFENLSIEYSGISEYDTNAKVNTDSVPENIKEAFTYSFSSDTDSLKNGDEITVEAKCDEKALKELGLSATETSKTFKVEGLNEYKESIKDCDYSFAQDEIKEKIESIFEKSEENWVAEILREKIFLSRIQSYTEEIRASDYEFTYDLTGIEAFYYPGDENKKDENSFAPIYKVDLNLDVNNGVGAIKKASNKSYQKTIYVSLATSVFVDKDNKVFVCRNEDGDIHAKTDSRNTLKEIEEKSYPNSVHESQTEKLEYK